ncbi:MAG: large-conductance mechanosensitive channel protein MscL [Pseudomonadota bacterium]
MGIIDEFKEFAIKGNMVDMAVGIIMGGAFGTIVKSLVDDVIMPPIGLLMGGVDFSNMKIVLKAAEGDAEAVAINYGLFFNAMIAFLIVAWVIFMLIKGMNAMKKKAEEEEAAAPPEPTKSEALLEEIRDALKARA